nr:enoyl-CoA hydratase-related protein [Roseateles koreensis]
MQLTLNRSATRNALTQAMVAALRAQLAALQSAPGEVRVLVLRGAGGNFCAGADLADMAQVRQRVVTEGAAALQAANAAFGHLCAEVASLDIATVAVLEGTVMGGGLGLACVVDVALAADTVDFRLPETALGLLPAQIAPFLIERLGTSQARRLAVTGARVKGAQALAMGLVHELHPAAQLDEALTRVLNDTLQCAPQALAVTKRLMRQVQRQGVTPQLLDEAAGLFAQAALGEEGLEGTAAFMARRPPQWGVTV